MKRTHMYWGLRFEGSTKAALPITSDLRISQTTYPVAVMAEKESMNLGGGRPHRLGRIRTGGLPQIKGKKGGGGRVLETVDRRGGGGF